MSHLLLQLGLHKGMQVSYILAGYFKKPSLLLCYYLVVADFTPNTPAVMFNPGSIGGDSMCFTISLNEDAILENDEFFTVMISDTGGAGQGAVMSATVTIDDNDGLLLCFETTHYREQQVLQLNHSSHK